MYSTGESEENILYQFRLKLMKSRMFPSELKKKKKRSPFAKQEFHCTCYIIYDAVCRFLDSSIWNVETSSSRRSDAIEKERIKFGIP